MLFGANLCRRRGQPLKVFTDSFVIANRRFCSAYARQRHHHILSQAVRSLIPLSCWSWHQLQFMPSGEMCQVIHWKQRASGQLQMNPLPATSRYESHHPAMLSGKGKLPVTDPLARCWSRGNFRIPTFTSSISCRLSISARNIYPSNTFQNDQPLPHRSSEIWQTKVDFLCYNLNFKK